MTPETIEANAPTSDAGTRPIPHTGTLLVVATLVSGFAFGCDSKTEPADASAVKPGVAESASDVAGTPVSADPATGNAGPRRVVAPPPEPLPPRADLAHEAPAIVAELESDPAYAGLFEPAHREDLDILLTGLSALLAEAPTGKRVVDEIKGRKLVTVLQAIGRVLARTGNLPDSLVAKLRAHLEAVASDDHRGLWLPTTSKQIRDYTTLAVYLDPNDPALIREMLSARNESWLSWNRNSDKPPKRPWLATEVGALERLEQLDDLTAAERARLEFLGLPTLPDGATCSAVAKLFGPESKKSSAQMEQLWPEYKGKRFSWKVKITDVSSAAIGSGYSVQAKCLGSESLIQDVQLEYGDEAKDFVLGLDRDSVHQLDGVLAAYSETFGLVADGHP
jgi:hypothetical protein